jgi:hypothetical protein
MKVKIEVELPDGKYCWNTDKDNYCEYLGDCTEPGC